MRVSEVHAQESHCPYFPFDQAREREREKENVGQRSVLSGTRISQQS